MKEKRAHKSDERSLWEVEHLISKKTKRGEEGQMPMVVFETKKSGLPKDWRSRILKRQNKNY
jgi:hypothetical protein